MLWEWQDQPGTARPLIADTTSQPGGRGANLKWVVDTNHLQPVGVVVRAMVVTSFLCVACRHLVVTLHWGRIISEASHAAGINVYILPPPVALRIKKSSKVLIKESRAARENCGDHGGVDEDMEFSLPLFLWLISFLPLGRLTVLGCRSVQETVQLIKGNITLERDPIRPTVKLTIALYFSFISKIPEYRSCVCLCMFWSPSVL